MPQLPRDVVRQRAARLRAKGEAARRTHLAGLVGSELELAVERSHVGRAPDFSEVVLENACEPGSMVRARVTGSDGRRLLAEVLP
jgi:threonylcarbamoyladenosine tRNA methylthiotransferase MtaB